MSKEEINKQFSRRLRRLMDRRGLSVKALCWAMGETSDKIKKYYGWLRGERTPSFDSLLKLHRVLGCTWEDLMGE